MTSSGFLSWMFLDVFLASSLHPQSAATAILKALLLVLSSTSSSSFSFFSIVVVVFGVVSLLKGLLPLPEE